MDEKPDRFACLRKGEVFRTFQEFSDVLQDYQSCHKIVFVLRNTHPIETHNRSIKKDDKKWPVEWRYKAVTFQCKFAGVYRSKATGKRSSSTFKRGCEAHLRLHANKERCGLVITDINLQHNNHYGFQSNGDVTAIPEQRRMSDAALNDVRELITRHVPVAKIVDVIYTKHNVKLLRYDVHNQRRKMREMEKESSLIEENISTQDFLQLVKDRPVLWQKSHAQFQNRDLRQALLTEIALVAGSTSYQCAKKLKGLKDTMRAQVAKLPKSPDGTPNFDDSHSVTWPHYKTMLFMKDEFVIRKFTSTTTTTHLSGEKTNSNTNIHNNHNNNGSSNNNINNSNSFKTNQEISVKTEVLEASSELVSEEVDDNLAVPIDPVDIEFDINDLSPMMEPSPAWRDSNQLSPISANPSTMLDSKQQAHIQGTHPSDHNINNISHGHNINHSSSCSSGHSLSGQGSQSKWRKIAAEPDEYETFAADIANDLRKISNPVTLMRTKASIRRSVEEAVLSELTSDSQGS